MQKIIKDYIKTRPNITMYEIPYWALIRDISHMKGGFDLKKRLYRKLGLDADDGYIVDPQLSSMFHALHYHLLIKLSKITKEFEKELTGTPLKNENDILIYRDSNEPKKNTDQDLMNLYVEQLSELCK